MVSILSDNSNIKNAFTLLIETLEEAGSGFHSALCIEASPENIRLSTKEPMPGGKELIRIPRSALMPGDQYEVNLIGDNLEIDYYPNTTLKDRQKKIISLMFEIYNLTAKISEHKKINFLLSLKDYPSLYEKLMEGRVRNPKYEKWYSGLQKGMEGAEYNDFLIETFIQTRPLGYSDPIRLDNISTIMPIIDFLNHHWNGARFDVVNGARAGDLTIASSQPIEGSTECYASYGVLDAADSLIRYNFVDQSAPILRSVALELDVPDGRKIKVDNKGHDPKVRSLPQELSDLILYTPTMDFQKTEGKDAAEQDMDVSFLLIGLATSGAPLSLRRVLIYIIRHMYDNFNRDINFNLSGWVAEAESKIVKKNIEHYKGVLKHTEDLIREKGASDNLSRIKILADEQLKKLDIYSTFVTEAPFPIPDMKAAKAGA